MSTTEQAKQISRELRNADSHIWNPDLINILYTVTNKGADTIDILIARLEEIESEWMRLSQEDGKAERAIERLTKNLDEQLRINSMRAEREYVLLEKVARLERARDATFANAKQWREDKTQKDAVITVDTSAMKKDQVPTELIRKLKVMYGLPPYNDPGNSARGDVYFFASIENEYSADMIEAAMAQTVRPMLSARLNTASSTNSTRWD